MSSLIRRYRQCDPAARSDLEVALLYPGVKAVLFHRLAHALWSAGLSFPARLVSEASRLVTGIEIHPGARIGAGLVIDHGLGVVIGETAVIGDNVLIYHGVTLGGTSSLRERRHPTVEDGVIIGAGAKVLGPIVLGRGSRVGANAVVTRDVEPETTVVGIPAKAQPSGAGQVAGTPLTSPPAGRPEVQLSVPLPAKQARTLRRSTRRQRPCTHRKGRNP